MTRDRARRAPLVVLCAAVAVAVLLVGVVVVRAMDDDEPTKGRLDAVLARSRAASAPFLGLTEVDLLLNGECRRVAVADDDTERASGLRGMPDPGPYAGMLFTYPEPKVSSFTMSGVTFPLEIVFYDEGGRPLKRHHMVPCPESIADCPGYPSDTEFLYALETYNGDVISGPIGGCPA